MCWKANLTYNNNFVDQQSTIPTVADYELLPQMSHKLVEQFFFVHLSAGNPA